MRVALRRVEATAAALGKKKIERKARSLVRSLSPLRQLEVDRQLLSRLREMALLPENVAAVLEARWGAEYAKRVEKASRVARSGKRRLLERRLRRVASRPQDDIPFRLEIARRRLEGRLSPPPEDATDKRLHRYRIAVKRARYLDIHLFRERLKETREESEERGSVGLVLELDHLIAALEGTVAWARREAFAVAGRFARVLPFLERSA